MNGVATESPRPGWGQVHRFIIIMIIIIIITEMCKAPPPRLKALNNITHVMYTEMESAISSLTKRNPMQF